MGGGASALIIVPDSTKGDSTKSTKSATASKPYNPKTSLDVEFDTMLEDKQIRGHFNDFLQDCFAKDYLELTLGEYETKQLGLNAKQRREKAAEMVKQTFGKDKDDDRNSPTVEEKEKPAEEE
jgi:hypothetical protein